MDLPAKSNTLLSSYHPAYLFIGAQDSVLEHITFQLQKLLCPADACSVCFICRKIREQQHESILWLCPEKQYAIDDLKVIFSTISFALDDQQHFFFVLQKADLLTTTCANALLKSLEEPPAGYHFILMAQRAELVLPTIKSRCLTQVLQCTDETDNFSSFISFFTTASFHDPMAFSKELESSNPSEWQSLTLLDQLITFWSASYKKSILAGDTLKQKQAERIMGHLKKALLQPPMPGSGKLFWKNLFLTIKEI